MRRVSVSQQTVAQLERDEERQRAISRFLLIDSLSAGPWGVLPHSCRQAHRMVCDIYLKQFSD
jgi:hypothetical protein